MKTIIMTGGTSGIGLAAARKMREASGIRLIVGARQDFSTGVLRLDLSSLSSVRRFAEDIERSLGEDQINGLVLNAGMQARTLSERTEDGFEPTFAVNHLAHYLLLRQLSRRLAPEAIVVITTSNLHDPKTNPMAPPAHANGRDLAKGVVWLEPAKQDARAVMRAYAASKLCNVLTARAFAASSIAQERSLRVIAFNPGFTRGTQLTRNHGVVFNLFVAAMGAVQSLRRPMNTVEDGGGLLADLALGRVVPPDGHLYASQVARRLTWPAISALACDDTVMSRLWRDSADLAGLPAEN